MLGGDGFQGSQLCWRLLESGNFVRVLDRASHNKASLSEAGGKLEWIEGDFSDASLLETAIADVDIVFHLICTTLPKTSNDNPTYDVVSNVVPSLTLLDKMRKHAVKKIIFFSSGGTVYGLPETVPIPETHPTNPICAYGIQKCVIEKYLHLYHVLYGLDYAVMRISNPYGFNQRHDKGQGVVAVFLDKMLRGETLEVWGDGSVVRDYIHVSDVVDAAVKLSEYGGQQRIFNIGSGRGLSLRDLIFEMSELLDRKPKINFMPARLLDVPINVLDITRAQQELDWTPKISLREGLNGVARHVANGLTRAKR